MGKNLKIIANFKARRHLKRKFGYGESYICDILNFRVNNKTAEEIREYATKEMNLKTINYEKEERRRF